MSGQNSKTKTRAWQAILPPPVSGIFPPGTGAVVEVAGVPSVTNGPAGEVLTSQAVGAPIFAPPGVGLPMKTTAPFSMPAPNATVVAAVNDTTPLTVGDWVYLIGAGWMAVTAIGGPLSVTLQNIPAVLGNAITGTVIPVSTKVTASGVGDSGVQGVFDVRRFGADPADINAGFYAACRALQLNGGGTVYIPPLQNGQMWQWLTTTHGIGINFADPPGPPASCEIVGAGTLIQVTANATGATFEIENATGHLAVRDLTFVGVLANAFDVGVNINLSGLTCEVERVNYLGIATLGGTFGSLHISADVITVRCCNFLGSQDVTPGGNTAVLTLVGSEIHIHDLAFMNSGLFGGTTYSRGTGNGWIRVVTADAVEINQCFFDTGTNAPLQFALGPNSHVRISSCTIRMPVTGGKTCILLDGSAVPIDSAIVERCVFSQGVGGLNTIISVNNCGAVDVRDNTFANADIHSIAIGANVKRLTIDSNVGHVSADTSLHTVLDFFQINKAPQPTAVGPFFVDPQNSSGVADDFNTGRTNNNVPFGSGPLLTTAHLSDVLYNKKLSANTTITYMSDDTSGTPLDYSTVNLNGFTLTFQGTPQTLHTGGTINAGTTAINPAAAGGGQRQTVHTTDIADFGPFVSTVLGGAATNPTRLVDTVTGDGAWVALGVGSATASVARPVTSGGAAGALTIGDAYKIFRGSILKLAAMMPQTSDGAIVHNDFAFTADSVGPNALGQVGLPPQPAYNRCSFLGAVLVGGTFSDCAWMAGTQGNYNALVSAGLWVPTNQDQLAGTINVSGDAFLTGPESLTIGASFIYAIAVFGGIGAGIQLQSFSNAAFDALQVGAGGAIFANSGLIWGNGNAGCGVSYFTGAHTPISSGNTQSVTGTAGDFAFRNSGGGRIQVARAWDNTVGAYTEAGGPATRTTTWAHFAATIAAGGFNFQAHCVECDAAMTASFV